MVCENRHIHCVRKPQHIRRERFIKYGFDGDARNAAAQQLPKCIHDKLRGILCKKQGGQDKISFLECGEIHAVRFVIKDRYIGEHIVQAACPCQKLEPRKRIQR